MDVNLVLLLGRRVCIDSKLHFYTLLIDQDFSLHFQLWCTVIILQWIVGALSCAFEKGVGHMCFKQAKLKAFHSPKVDDGVGNIYFLIS